MKALLILNHQAGSLNGACDSVASPELLDLMLAHGIEAEERGAKSTRLHDVLDAAIAERPASIWVGGGDGTIHTAANRLTGTGIPLGVLPLGSLNHFARDLGVPVAWRHAVISLARGEVRAVDVGEVNGQVFINNCSIGSYPEAVRHREALRHTRGIGKAWAMVLASIAVFRRLRRIRLRLTIEGRSHDLRTPFVVVSNNRYAGHVLDYSLRSRLDEGRLWLYTTRARRHLAVLRLLWQSLLREIDDVEGLEKHEFTRARLEHAYPRLPIALDGELVQLESPLEFRIRPAALHVIVPPRPISA